MAVLLMAFIERYDYLLHVSLLIRCIIPNIGMPFANNTLTDQSAYKQSVQRPSYFAYKIAITTRTYYYIPFKVLDCLCSCVSCQIPQGFRVTRALSTCAQSLLIDRSVCMSPELIRCLKLVRKISKSSANPRMCFIYIVSSKYADLPVNPGEIKRRTSKSVYCSIMCCQEGLFV